MKIMRHLRIYKLRLLNKSSNKYLFLRNSILDGGSFDGTRNMESRLLHDSVIACLLCQLITIFTTKKYFNCIGDIVNWNCFLSQVLS